jgi:hypothetical protein
MALQKSRTRPKAPSPITDAELSWLIAALGRGQVLDPADILPALHELQRCRAAKALESHEPGCHCSTCMQVDAFPACPPVSHKIEPHVVLRDGEVFAERRSQRQAIEHRDYRIATGDGCAYEVIPASEVRS